VAGDGLTHAVARAGQRHYYATPSADCADAGTIAVTIPFGLINYFGATPKLTCH
jgi:hypothetical protein